MKIISKILILVCFCQNTFSQNSDINLLRDFNVNRNKSFDSFHKGISNTATPVNIGFPIILYTIGHLKHTKNAKQKSLVIAASTLTSFLLTSGIKEIVRRPRPFVTYPEIDNVIFQSSYSFPSSHTSTTFSLATSISLSYPKWYVIAPSFLWAGTVSYSRMHLGVHYLSDVLGGVIIGSGSAYLCYYFNKKWFAKNE